MGGRFRSLKWNRVFIDVCTQHDFLDPGAILQVSNLARILPPLRNLYRWVRAAEVPVVSIVESHRPSEPPNGFPMHCIDGTPGQQKVPFTLLTPGAMVENDNYLSVPSDLRKNYRQLVFRKRTKEILSNPKTDRFLTQMVGDEFVIFGVGLERSIKSLALGLLARQKTVSVVIDACGCWSAADAELATRQLAAKGVTLLTTEELTAPPPPRPVLIATRRTRRYADAARGRTGRVRSRAARD